MDEQIPFLNSFPSIITAHNPEPRCPCVLILDVSGSMSGAPIRELIEGVETLQKELQRDSLANRRVELAVVTFGDKVELAADFCSPDQLKLPSLKAEGFTPMGEAVVKAASLLQHRKREYQEQGLQYFRPWMFLITDGEPTDEDSPLWNDAIRLVREGEEKGHLLFFGVAVNEADQSKLNELCPRNRPSLKLSGLKFRDLFLWLTRSLKAVSGSRVGDRISLPAPGWNEISA
jgi:uncharacterized protein YegL